MSKTMTKAQKLKILEKLESMYPEAKAELVFSNPYEMLVATMLSALPLEKCASETTNCPQMVNTRKMTFWKSRSKYLALLLLAYGRVLYNA